MLRNDSNRQLIKQCRERLFQSNAQGSIAQFFHFIYKEEIRTDRRVHILIQNAADRKYNIVRGQCCSIVEFYIITNIEGICQQIITDLIIGCYITLWLTIYIRFHQASENHGITVLRS